MRRFALLSLLALACNEPAREPSDVGPRPDGGAMDAEAPDGGSNPSDGGSTPTDGGSDVDSGVMPTGICENKPCLTSIGSEAEWGFVSGSARAPSRCDLAEEAFFAIPKEAGTAIAEPLYVDADSNENLYFFLEAYLSTQLADLDPDVYYRTFERSDTRTYWTGRIFRTASGEYAFDLIADFYFGPPPDQTVLDQIRVQLMDSFAFPLAYAPQDESAIDRARAFTNPPFTVLLPEPCAGEGCTDPSAPCAIIPEGTELCGHFSEGRLIPGELAAKIRLTTIAGSYELPSQAGTTTMRLISGGEFGPDRTPIDASADGTLTTQDFGGTLYYQYAQTITAGAHTIALEWTLAPAIYREPRLTRAGAYGVLDGTEQIVAGSCTAAGLHLYFAEGKLANGDSFRFSYRHDIPFAGSGPLFLTGAEVMIGGQSAVVRDYFDLTYSGQHHNWDNQFVITFDQPLTYGGHDVYGIWIDEAGFRCCPADSISTLDAGLQKLDTLTVESYVRAPLLF